MQLSAHGAILLTFATFGAVVGSHVGALPKLIATSGISPFAFGVVAAIGMISNIVAMSLGGLLGGLLGRRIDHRSALLIALPCLGVAFVYALLVGSLLSFTLSFVFMSFALGTIDLFMNAEASVVEQSLGRPVFNSYHGTVSLGIAGFAIVGSLVAVLLQPWFLAVLVLPLLGLCWAAIYKIIPPGIAHHEDTANAAAPPLPRRILTFVGLAAGFNVACEGAAILWAGQLLSSIAPELAAISGLGVAFYGLCGGTVRMMGDGMRSRWGDLRVMTVSLFIAIAGFSVLGLAPGFWWSVAAFACVGFGLAVTFPCLFSLTGKIAPQNRAAAMGYVAFIGGFPRIILPYGLGLLAGQFALGAVFSACAVVALVALIIITFSFAKAEQWVAST